jgi:hypothetical protein
MDLGVSVDNSELESACGTGSKPAASIPKTSQPKKTESNEWLPDSSGSCTANSE